MYQKPPSPPEADFIRSRRLSPSLLAVFAILAPGARAGVLELKAPNPSATGMFGYFFGDTVGVPDLNGDGVGDLVVGGSYEDLEGVVNGEVRRVTGVELTYVFDGATGEVVETMESPVGGEFWITSTTDNGGETLGSWVFARGKSGGNGRVYLVSERDSPTHLFIGRHGLDYQIGYIGKVAGYALEESLDLREWTEVCRLDLQKDHHPADPADTQACLYRVRLVE